MPATITARQSTLQNNIALAVIFHRMADCYRYLGNQERFRAIAYENVSKLLYNMKEDIAVYAKDVKSLDAISGIGESIAEKIMEYLQTGGIKTFEQLKKRVPYKLLELMDITGIGPATLKLLHQKTGVNNREELVKILQEDKLQGITGFASQKITNLKRALKLEKVNERMLLADAQKIGLEILAGIQKIPGVQKATLAGSLRRKQETVGDIDIIAVADSKNRRRVVNRFTALPGVEKVLAKGSTKISVLLKKKVQVDVRIVHEYEYGAALLYFTGNKEHNIRLRIIARNRNCKINEYGIFDAVTNKRLAGATEEEMYRFLNLNYIPPEQRLGKDEIEKAMLH